MNENSRDWLPHGAVSSPTPQTDAFGPELTAQLVRRLAALPTANVGDAMERLGVVDSRIQSMWHGARLAGPAFTVWTRSGDNAFIHKALGEARPGDVIVVNGQGDESRALIGELIGARARARGIAGFVIDGAIRDASGLARLGMPVFARTVTPAGPYKHGPGRLGAPVAVGSVVVMPGDLILGDEDGVVVVPRLEARTILIAAEAIHEAELQRLNEIETQDGVQPAADARQRLRR